MRQLTGHEASFLYADTVQANANVTFVQIYDQSTAPGGRVRFKSILAHIESRLHRSPVFRSKLLRVPLELDHPYWIDDENFDLEYHVRHIALPAPGDWRQFCIQASRIHARALDLNRPLWEIYVIEGLDAFADLPAGSFALLTKIHHAAVDVESRHEIVEVLHDTTRRPAPATPPEPWFPERAPSLATLMGASALHTLLSPLKLMAPLLRLAPTALTFAQDLLRTEAQAATRFNAVVSPHRVFETRRFALDDFERIAGLVEGATVDDAVLAVCAGGLRRYLQGHAELPQADLAAVVPAADTPAASLRIRLGTGVADPVQRLALIHAQTCASAALARADAERRLIDLGESAPAAALAFAGRHFHHASRMPGSGLPLATCTVTRVPGPPEPCHLIGARMSYFSALLPIADGMGLVLAVTRHDGQLIVSPTSCRELMPDPQAFAQALRDSFQETLALADPAPRPSARSAAPRASASGRPGPADRKARSAATALPAAKDGRRRSTAPRR
jgi:WS/DGAT/MGAT family acyltransferase